MRIPYRHPFAVWSIHHLMLLGFGLVFLVVGAISLLVYRNTSILITNTKLDTRSQRLVKGLDDLLALLEEAERSSRRYLVTGDDSYLEAHQAAVDLAPAYVLTFQESLQESPVQQERVRLLETRIKRVLDAERAGIVQRQKHGYQGVRPLVSGRDANRELEGVRLILSEISREETESIERRAHDSAASTRLNIWLLGGGTLLQCVLLSSVYYLIRHDLVGRFFMDHHNVQGGFLMPARRRLLDATALYDLRHVRGAPIMAKLRVADGAVRASCQQPCRAAVGVFRPRINLNRPIVIGVCVDVASQIGQQIGATGDGVCILRRELHRRIIMTNRFVELP